MRIVIVGDGKVGVTLMEQLSREGHNIVIIDNNAQVLHESVEEYDVLGVLGNGASLRVQQEAQVGESDLLIAATSADEVNLLCCILGRKLGVRHTIARVRNPEYFEQLSFLKEELGLSMTINPERTAAMEILNLLRFPAAIRRDTFAKGRVEIIELKVRPDSPLSGRRLAELPRIAKTQVLVCAVERNGRTHIPDGNFELREGDRFYVTGTGQNLAALARRLGAAEHKIKSVMIIGGSRIAFYLAAALLEDGAAVKIIEIDPVRCAQLVELLPKANIVCADGARPDVLASEGLGKVDALVTLTNIDEENMVLSMYGLHLGASKAITKINSMEYNEVFRDMGVETIVSPKALVCNEIVRYVRAMRNTSGNAVLALHRIAHDSVDALEFSVTEDTKNLGVQLRDVQLKPNILLACINRGGKIIIPDGGVSLRRGDSVVVLTPAELAYSSLNSIFA